MEQDLWRRLAHLGTWKGLGACGLELVIRRDCEFFDLRPVSKIRSQQTYVT